LPCGSAYAFDHSTCRAAVAPDARFRLAAESDPRIRAKAALDASKRAEAQRPTLLQRLRPEPNIY
jgi:hypothetical protein